MKDSDGKIFVTHVGESSKIAPTCYDSHAISFYSNENFSKTEYEIRKIFMLVPKTPDSQVRNRDLPTITEKPTVYDYSQSQVTSAVGSQ